MRKGLWLCLYLLVSVGVSAQMPTQLRQLYSVIDSSLTAGDYSACLDHALQATKVADEIGDCRWQAESYRRLGIAYDYLKNKEDAWKWLRASLQQTADCASADTMRMRTERYLGAMFFGTQQGDSAVHYLSASADLMLQNGFYAEAASAYGMMGEAYSTLIKDPSRAQENYLESIRLARISKEQYALGFALFRYGCHLARNEECLRGKPFIDSSYIIFTKLNSTEGIRWALNGLAYAESRCGNGIAVYNYMSRIQNITDSLFLAETAMQSAHFEALYEKDKQDQAITALEQRTRNQRMYIAGIVLSVLLLSVILYLIISRRALRNKQAADHVLHELQLQNIRDVMEAENKERQRIAAELHDSLGQILSAARMHISVIDNTLPNVEKANILLDEASKEVRSISHNLMPASLQALGLIAALKQVIRSASPNGIPEIVFDHEGYSSTKSDHDVFIYRILQELISNSIRHGRSRHIYIRLSNTAKNVNLEMRDDGQGFDPALLQNSEGMGMKNIRTRVDLMRGTLRIESTPLKGSHFHITLPL